MMLAHSEEIISESISNLSLHKLLTPGALHIIGDYFCENSVETWPDLMNMWMLQVLMARPPTEIIHLRTLRCTD